MKKILFFITILTISGCITSTAPLKTGYLVVVESGKQHKTVAHKLQNSAAVDSIIARNFGYAFTGFNSDTLLYFNPYFKIETPDKTIYVEKKEMRYKNGKLVFRKL